jgi:hypothetical protein
MPYQSFDLASRSGRVLQRAGLKKKSIKKGDDLGNIS